MIDVKSTGKPPALKNNIQTLKTIHFLIFFLILFVIFDHGDLDPESAETKINADHVDPASDPQHWKKVSFRNNRMCCFANHDIYKEILP
jgi:hypothetical protein